MRPATKYAATAILYRTSAQGIWEHEIFHRLRTHYPPAELHALREDLVSMSTVGWLNIVDEREYRGQLLRRYALADGIRPFIRFQLRIGEILTFLGGDADKPDQPLAVASAEGTRP
ncbi:MAG: hypothetical protein ACRDRL_15840 [Sciscionella sp.]